MKTTSALICVLLLIAFSGFAEDKVPVKRGQVSGNITDPVNFTSTAKVLGAAILTTDTGVAKTGDTMTGPLVFSHTNTVSMTLKAVTTSVKNAWTPVEDGSLCYDSTLGCVQVYSNGAWTNASGGTWGSITGTLSSQTDLQSALNNKADTSSLASVATAGTYNSLSTHASLSVTGATVSGSLANSSGMTVSVAASTVPYTSTSPMTSTTVQGAIDYVAAHLGGGSSGTLVAGAGLSSSGSLGSGSMSITVTTPMPVGTSTGDICYWSASTNSWVVLPAGTATHVLTTNGAGSAPSWNAGGGGSSLPNFGDDYINCYNANLVAFWKMNESSDSRWDIVHNVPLVQAGSPSTTTWGSCTVLALNGSQFLWNWTPIPAQAKTIAISVWFKTGSDVAGEQVLVMSPVRYSGADDVYDAFNIYQYSSKLRLSVSNSAGDTSYYAVGSTTLTTNTIYHAFAYIDHINNHSYLILDGASEADVATDSGRDGTRIYVGTRMYRYSGTNSATAKWNGSIGPMGIWANMILSETGRTAQQFAADLWTISVGNYCVHP